MTNPSEASMRALASLWSLDEEATGKPSACIASTYEFNAEFFEQNLLSRFLRLRYDATDERFQDELVAQRDEFLSTSTVAVMVDDRRVSDSASTLLWDQVPVAPRHGLQHAKVTLLAWERHIRVLIGSANLTPAGYETNREVVFPLDFRDHRGSHPRSLLFEVLAFLAQMVSVSNASSTVSARLKAAINAVRVRAASWSNIPANGEQDDWALHFVAHWPRDPDGPGVGAQIRDLWGNRILTAMTIVTPFTGTQDKHIAAALDSVRPKRLGADCELRVILPVEQTRRSESDVRVHADAIFRDVMHSRWEKDIHWAGIPVDEPVDDEGLRALHAKVLCLESKSRVLLSVGSSNFTARGLGTHVRNIEANLAVEFPNSQLHGEFEVEYLLGSAEPIEFDPRKVAWVSNAEQEEEPVLDRVPSYFVRAVLFADPVGSHANTGEVQWRFRIDFNPAECAPSTWSLLLPAAGVAAQVLLLSKQVADADDSASVDLPEGRRPETVHHLIVTWLDREALIPVLLESRENYPLSTDRIDMSAEEIQLHLLAGRDGSRAVEHRRQTYAHTKGLAAEIDPLRLVTTKGFLLYRTRRLGQAIAECARRIEETPASIDAMRFRVFNDPLSPMRLARALREQLHAELVRPHNHGLVEGCVFGMAELILMLAFAGASAERRAISERVGVAGVFHGGVRELNTLAESVAPHGTVSSVRDYLHQCNAKAQELLRFTLDSTLATSSDASYV